MARPFSRRTLLTRGKLREIAEANIDAAISLSALTHLYRVVLSDIGCLIFSSDDLANHGATEWRRALKRRSASTAVPRIGRVGREQNRARVVGGHRAGQELERVIDSVCHSLRGHSICSLFTSMYRARRVPIRPLCAG